MASSSEGGPPWTAHKELPMFNTFIPGSIARAAAFVVCCVIVPASCASRARTGGDFQPDRATEMSFTGRVVDEEDKSVPSAVVGINSVQGSTDDKGAFVVTPAKAERYVLTISHPDYADITYVSRGPIRSHRWRLTRAQVSTVDSAQPITLTDQRRELVDKRLGGASIRLNADSLVDPLGRRPAGRVRATIATLDVSNGEGPADWAVRSDDGREEGYLVSYGAVYVQFTDSMGQVKYQLGPGNTAELTLPVVRSMLMHAPASPVARFWYYDTSDGYWKKNGEGAFDPARGAYVGKVDHLSTINTDIAKFGDAACLKIELDPSIAPGNKLRIRYHSGGTPFGQSPMFVMNDVINAAYRLPADTNVLLELLDATNQVYGDLVVEDPAGTSLVNTVVNTGTAIPAGGSLWPPGPAFVNCKPIRLRLGLPEVELRINELATDSASLKDNPTDDYVTWAPTFCRARLTTAMASPVTVVLTNDAPGSIAGGGDVNFAAHATPWPAANTATASSLTLSLPGDGSWVPFVIAGKFGSPSTNDKDAIIEAHMAASSGAVLGTQALMVRVRKDANKLQPSERDRFLFALKNFRNQSGANYVRFQEMHRLAGTAGDEGHGQPAFLSWHRAMLLDVERELQKIDPSVALHYWNWDAASPNVFSPDFIGAAGNNPASSIALPNISTTNPLWGWNTDLPFSGGELRRNESDHTLNPGFAEPLDDLVDPCLVERLNYGPRTGPGATGSFSYGVENSAHNDAHGWTCGNGNINSPNRSATDPLFYLLHSQIEHEWAYWQLRARDAFGVTHERFGVWSSGSLVFRVPEDYDNTGNWNAPLVTSWQKGSFLNDGIWPWDGTSGAGGPDIRDDRPINQAPLSSLGQDNIPNSRPIIPNTPFPASVQKNLWPASATVPTNAHMIDYLGKFRPQDGLGFCYDDVPYN